MHDGSFLVLEENGTVVGSVYVQVHGDTGYFGMLSIDPARQGQGLGSRLIAAAEDHCRDAECRTMELEVVNLRTELPPFYRRFGYAEAGTRPFTEHERTKLPCHFIVMSKAL
jgi:ribosomal protein S18 acetylase RimI-like enzyme